ncbi:MAG: MFS transporter [Thermoflavifilum sp.]|nr:MFS transporter [Thermoflavifilum sp.]MCL6515284.1 MFS transporter [Alicyclobacillus sp.]
MNRQESRYRWVVLGTALFAYYLIVTQRTAPGLVTNAWISELHISAGMFGLMDSVQFLAYALLQVPVGVMADRLGPNRLLIAGTLINGVGTLLTSVSHQEGWLFTARFLVGVGDATIFVNLIAVVNQWFRAQEFVALLGVVGLTAGFGSLTATVPYALWIRAFGWRSLFFATGCILVALCAVLYVVLIARPRRIFPSETTPAPQRVRPRSVRTALRETFASRQSYALAMCHFGLVGTYVGFMGSWGVAYFMQVFGMSRAAASSLLMLGLFGAMAGGPVTSWLASKSRHIRRLYTAVHAATFLSWFLWFALGSHPSIGVLILCLLLIGFGNGGSSLTFAMVRQSFPNEMVGVASGFANMGGFLSAVLLPTLFGSVLDACSTDKGMAFHMAMAIPALFTLVGLLGVRMAREGRAALGAVATSERLG